MSDECAPPAAKRPKEESAARVSFDTTLLLNLNDGKDSVQCSLGGEATQDAWRRFITTRGEGADSFEPNWATRLFDALNGARIVLPLEWDSTFIFHDYQSKSKSILFKEFWYSILSQLICALNQDMDRIQSGEVDNLRLALLYIYPSFTVGPASDVNSVARILEETLTRRLKYDWARTSGQETCPISQLALEKPVWLSSTGRTYSMQWLTDAINKSFQEELPLRLEDVTLRYYNVRGVSIIPHSFLWNEARDGDRPSPVDLSDLIQGSLSLMVFDRQAAKNYNIPSFANVFMALLPGEGDGMNMSLERVRRLYDELRTQEPLPPDLRGSASSDGRLLVQHTVIKQIVLWKAHLKVSIAFANVLFKKCTVTWACWCGMQLKRCRFEQCVFTVKEIARCELINCEFVDCQFVGKDKDLINGLGDDEQLHSDALARHFQFEGTATFSGCRLVTLFTKAVITALKTAL